MSIPMEKWGKDHWTTLAYVETRAVDGDGVLDRRHMRCDSKLHPLLAHYASYRAPPTQLKNLELLPDHDDWDCLDDIEVAGLVVDIGTGIGRKYQLTDLGWKIAGALRRHLAEHRTSGTFNPPKELLP